MKQLVFRILHINTKGLVMLQDGTQRYFIYQEEEPSHHFQPDTTSKAELQTWCNPPTPPIVGFLTISDVCATKLVKIVIRTTPPVKKS